MRSKRLLAFLLTFCLVFANLAPAASAIEAGVDSVVNAGQNSSTGTAASTDTSSKFDNDLLVSPEDAAQGSNTLRDKQDLELEGLTKNEEGNWVITSGEAPELGLLQTEIPACLEELKEAAELYSADEIVRAFVVMQDAPLAESYTSPLLVSASLEQQMIQKQDNVIAAIERTVLQGEKLNVRYQFTYLTNSFTIETEFANLEKIAYISGVKSVFVAPVYDVCETVSNPNTAASGAMTGVSTVWENLGYTGEGMKIAVIDTGLDLDHPSFGALDADMVEGNDNYMDMDDIAAVLEDLNAYSRRGTITAKTLYRSTKVPYAFNYVDGSLTADHSSDSQGDHGTHVAGIAAANKVEGTSVVGMAPDAQLIIMKVFGANGGAYTDDIVAALEDAMTLGCDVVNASLGSASGFSESGSEEIDAIYDRLANQNIIATISAGNEGTSSYDNMWGTDLNRTNNPDNATIGSPALYHNAFSIASAENCEVQTPYFTLSDGTVVFFNNDSYGYYYGYTSGMAPLIGEELEFVVIDGYGEAADFYAEDGTSLVEGKVAVVFRGSLTFGVKISNAESAGAVACIIANNGEDDIFNFMMNDSLTDSEGNIVGFPSIPCCMITKEDGEMMANTEAVTLCVSAETGARVVEGGQMSSFSSWGVSPDLRLVPDITGIGGNVYSCYDGGKYGIMSGTSMSSPQLAGISALVMQYIYEVFPDLGDDGEVSALAMALLMSTADPIISTDSDLEASPRQQGSGLVNAAEAVKTKAYLTVNGDRPKAELGDSTSGYYTFTFEIHNISNEAETYVLSSSLLTEDYIDYGIGEYFMAGYERELSGSVTFSKDKVTVPAGQSAIVTVTINLSDEDKAYFARYWENGGYVEGYIYLDNTNEYGVDLNLPFLGFYGDWTQAPVFDSGYWYDNTFWGLNSADGYVDAEEYYHVLWTDLAGSSWVLGFNPYSGAYVDGNYNIVYDSANNSVSPNGDGVIDGLSNIYVSLLRNAKTMTFTYTNAETGEVLARETIENNRKTMYYSSYGQVVPFIYSWYGEEGLYNFKGLENNTKVLLTIDATVNYGNGGTNSIQFPITVDLEAPTLLDAYQITEEDGSHSLVLITDDNVNVAAMYLMNRAGTQIYDVDYAFESRDDGTYVTTFNVDELGTELMVCVGDYAGNEGYYNITYTAAGDNLPEMDTSLLYAYRNFDYIVQYYQGYDYMFGWMSMNKPDEDYTGYDAAWIEPLTNDYLEYYALVAAEYAGGKVFAVDAGYNLVAMEPGVWNRTTICNLGVNVLDMTFDDSTGTMYVLTKEDSYYVSLQTLDVMTGELTEVKSFGAYTRAPLVIADDDNGNIYAIKYSYGYSYDCDLYVLNEANGYALTSPVQVPAGTDETTGETYYSNLKLVASNGKNAYPSMTQSMTYVDGKLYWAYFNYNAGSSEFFVIDTENDFSYTIHDTITYYDFADTYTYSITELAGLLSLEETQWQVPTASTLESVSLSTSSLVMTPGASQNLSVSATPWNYKLGELTWTSSDETVATVVDGKVTAVSEGTAVITVSTEGVTATCSVIVVDTATTFNAYNYYSADGYYGYMIEVDTGAMDYSLVAQSPVDFLAGDYNANDGYFYGYSEGGQFWRYDPETGVAVKLGDPIGTAPSDMAYDYSTGKMYATMVYSSWWSSYSTVNVVDLNNGQMEPFYSLDFYSMMTLACDLEGNLYSITADGTLLKLYQFYDDWFEECSWGVQALMFDLGYMGYAQSMCWDYANDVLLWAYPELSTVVWLDPTEGYAISLGDPTESGSFEFVGMYTVPEVLPELPDVAVQYVDVSDMMLLVGASKTPCITVRPTNATCQNIVWTSSDSSVAAITADGSVKGVSAGTATVSGTLEDTVSGETFTLEFQVTVLASADDMYGMVMTDLATYGSQYWIRLYATDPSNPDNLTSTNYVIYAEEYYDGKLYAFGYDGNDWDANWQFMVIDPKTYAIESITDLGEGFPFVYDMTYDYSTSTMYAVAGSQSASDFYAVDMETGELHLLAQTEQFFMSLTSVNGTLYAMEQSQNDEYDSSVLNAQLYTIDPLTGTVEWFADTGVASNMIASMAYDYDTGYIYWTAMCQSDSYTGGLCLIDPATGAATNLGPIGTIGAQVSGLYFICESYPTESELSLLSVVMDTTSTAITVGESLQLNAVTLPVQLDAQIVWSSSDESVATVDNGVVTGISQGKAIITATVTYNGVTMTAQCAVGVLAADAAFLTWNITDMGWSTISRADYSVVTNLTEGEEVGVQSFTSVGDAVYGFDANNCFFQLNTETFERTVIGTDVTEYAVNTYLVDNSLEETPTDGFSFEVRDMAYDVAANRVLVLGAVLLDGEEINYGDYLYSVDLATGELTSLYCFADFVYVYGMTVDTNGTVYFYTTFNDGIYKLNVEAATYTMVTTLQSMSVYGEEGHRHTMYYDDLSGKIYMQITTNGKFYRMIIVNPVTGSLTIYDDNGSRMDIGEVVYDRATWSYKGDHFAGMTFVDLPEQVDAEYAGVSLSLAGDIGLNFYWKLSDKVVNDSGSYLTFTYADGTVTTVPVSEATVINGEYRFSCQFAAKEMGVRVTAQIFTSEGAVSEAITSSIQDYAVKALESDKESLIALMKAMLNYGAAAQVEFGYDTDNLVNSILSAEDQVLSTVDASEYAYKLTGSEDGLAFDGASLILNSETSLRIYFKLTGSKTVEDYTFTIDGETVQPVAHGSSYYIQVSNISAKDLDVWHTFTLGDITIEYAPLSYVDRVQAVASSDVDLVNLVTALYLYNQAADTYFGN